MRNIYLIEIYNPQTNRGHLLHYAYSNKKQAERIAKLLQKYNYIDDPDLPNLDYRVRTHDILTGISDQTIMQAAFNTDISQPPTVYQNLYRKIDGHWYLTFTPKDRQNYKLSFNNAFILAIANLKHATRQRLVMQRVEHLYNDLTKYLNENLKQRLDNNETLYFNDNYGIVSFDNPIIEEEVRQDYRPFTTKSGICGYLMPDGHFYECLYGQHQKLAKRLTRHYSNEEQAQAICFEHGQSPITSTLAKPDIVSFIHFPDQCTDEQLIWLNHNQFAFTDEQNEHYQTYLERT